MNPPKPRFTDGSFNLKEKTQISSSYSNPIKNSKDLDQFNDMSDLTGCALDITPPSVIDQPERVCHSVSSGGPQALYVETGVPRYMFPDSQISNTDVPM